MSENIVVNNDISWIIYEQIGKIVGYPVRETVSDANPFYQEYYEKITKVVSVYDDVYIFHARNPIVKLGEKKKISNVPIKYDEEIIDKYILKHKNQLTIKGFNGEYIFNEYVDVYRYTGSWGDISHCYIVYSRVKKTFYITDNCSIIKDFKYLFRSKKRNKAPTPIIELISTEELIKRVEDNGK